MSRNDDDDDHEDDKEIRLDGATAERNNIAFAW